MPGEDWLSACNGLLRHWPVYREAVVGGRQIGQVAARAVSIAKSPPLNRSVTNGNTWPTCVGADPVLSHRADARMSRLGRILAQRACGFYAELPGSPGDRHAQRNWLTPTSARTRQGLPARYGGR